MTFPQRISYVTLGVRDMPTLRGFYAEMGWRERAGSSDDFATYDAGGVLLALYPLGQLGQEAAPGDSMPGRGWNGITLGVNVESTEVCGRDIPFGVGGRGSGGRRSGQA